MIVKYGLDTVLIVQKTQDCRILCRLKKQILLAAM